MYYVFETYIENSEGGTDTKWVIAEESVQVSRYLRELGFKILEVAHRIDLPLDNPRIDYDWRKR